MTNVRERSDPDLPGWTRKNDRVWISPGGWEWQHVRRNELDDLTAEQWDAAIIILRRPYAGWLPCGPEGLILGNVLHEVQGFGHIGTTTLRYVARFSDDDDRAFITRAVKDKNAHLALLIPPDAR